MPRCFRDRQISPKEDHRFCVYCGHPLVMPCPYCSADVPLLTDDRHTRRCPGCRHALKACPSPDCGRLLPLEAQACPAGHTDPLIEPFGEWIGAGGDPAHTFCLRLSRPLKTTDWPTSPIFATDAGSEIVGLVSTVGVTVAATRSAALLSTDGDMAGVRPYPLLPPDPWRAMASNGILYVALPDHVAAIDLSLGGQWEIAGSYVTQTMLDDAWLGLRTEGSGLEAVRWRSDTGERTLGTLDADYATLVASETLAYAVTRKGGVWQIAEDVRPIAPEDGIEAHHVAVSSAGLMVFGRLGGESVVRYHAPDAMARTIVLPDLEGFATPPMIGERSFWVVGVGEPPTIRQYHLATGTQTQRVNYGYSALEACVALESAVGVSFVAVVRDPQRKVVVLTFPQGGVLATLLYASPTKVPAISVSEDAVAIGNSQTGDNKVRVFTLPLE